MFNPTLFGIDLIKGVSSFPKNYFYIRKSTAVGG